MQTHIKVLYFAQVAEIAGTRSELWQLSQPVRVSDWLTTVVDKHPAIEPLRKRLKVAINQYYVNHSATINPGDEVALFEPVTGG
ncbi:molybdopterin converting factor subunit 1 [Paenalcaligenes niemegkensis]|uniref:molybdopterin converting factor subunit 1 n=1 Tax=Paenalcaligenes niemegkensis TaxID=2895469 RepID=UPI001EE9064F|nr:molybdopterin converting factor subunit 1 [Paenalcaligenes niemegkensis]MCQ9617191.1 molybdopterin converting factor subunit 1 [Paenalcaligenes niemegkensis]